MFESLNYTPDPIAIPDASNYADILSKISHDNIRQYNPNWIMEKIPLDRIIEHISDFTAEMLDDLRHILLAIDYDVLSEEVLSSITQFKRNISSLLQNEEIHLDCIKKLQLRWICAATDNKTDNNSE